MQCHHIVVEDWARMQDPHGTLFVSIPSLLDPSLCPAGTHIVHMFTPDWMDNWQVRPPDALCLPLLKATWTCQHETRKSFHDLRNGAVL